MPLISYLSHLAVLSLLAKTFLTLLVVIDPIGLVPIFITLAGSRSSEEQTAIARRAVLIAAGILLVFALGGTFLLNYLGISLEAFRIAAGILLFKVGLDLVFLEAESAATETPESPRPDISVFPLAIPLLAGPGTLATLPVLASEANDYYQGLAIVLSSAGAVLVISYLLFRFSGYFTQLLGVTGINAITRVIGILLAALAIQYIGEGAIAFLQTTSFS